MKTFFAAGIGLAAFLEFLLISKKNKTGSDKILTLWMFLILLHLFFFTLYFTGDIYDFPFLLGFEHPLPLLHGVFLYFYTASLTQQLPADRRLIALHFLPGVLTAVYLVPFLLLPSAEKIVVYQNRGAGYELFNTVKWYAVACSGILYVAWSFLLLKRHASNIRDQFSDVEKINLRWLQFLTIGLGIIWCLVIFLRGDTFVFAGVVVFVFLIGFFGVRQVAIFRPEVSSQVEVEQKEKYQKSGLTEEAARDLHEQLNLLMRGEALYKKSDLSITDLSSRLNVHPNYLSQVVNQKEKKNFYDYVNSFRIEEFKRLIALQRNRQFTLLSLAYDCGFSSKTSFNRCFKKATGLTPSEYVTKTVGVQAVDS